MKNQRLILVPPHIMLTLHLCLSRPMCILHYKWCYKGKYIDLRTNKTVTGGMIQNLKIKWPVKKPILSKRDRTIKLFINYEQDS